MDCSGLVRMALNLVHVSPNLNLVTPLKHNKKGNVMDDFIYANIHRFKTHISKYIRKLENGEAKAIIVERNGTRVALLIPYETKKKD